MRRRKRLWFIHLQPLMSPHADTLDGRQSSRACESHTRRTAVRHEVAPAALLPPRDDMRKETKVSEGNRGFPSEALAARPGAPSAG
jgi:hypothetical protein